MFLENDEGRTDQMARGIDAVALDQGDLFFFFCVSVSSANFERPGENCADPLTAVFS